MEPIKPDVRDVIARYVANLRALGVCPTRVLLFGSHARGTAGPYSDIDLLVVSPDFDRIPPPEHPKLLAKANWDLFAPIQTLWTTPAALEAASPASFLREVVRTGVDVA